MSFPPVTEMFQFTGFASPTYGFSRRSSLRMGFPHSEIHGSTGARPSPWLIAACHVLHRLSVPRHPPDALIRRLILSHAQGQEVPANVRGKTRQHTTGIDSRSVPTSFCPRSVSHSNPIHYVQHRIQARTARMSSCLPHRTLWWGPRPCDLRRRPGRPACFGGGGRD